MGKIIILALLLAIGFSCEKPDHCYTCYITYYYPKADTVYVVHVESFRMRGTQQEIDIFESYNNVRDSTGFGESIECKLHEPCE